MNIDFAYHYEQNDLMRYFFLSCSLAAGGVENLSVGDSSKIDVVLTINGKEVSILDVIGNLEKRIKSVESRDNVLVEVKEERYRQYGKWGGPAHDDNHTTAEFVQWIEDYAGWARMMASMQSFDKARRRLVQVSSLAIAAVESIDRKNVVRPTEK